MVVIPLADKVSTPLAAAGLEEDMVTHSAKPPPHGHLGLSCQSCSETRCNPRGISWEGFSGVPQSITLLQEELNILKAPVFAVLLFKLLSEDFFQRP